MVLAHVVGAIAYLAALAWLFADADQQHRWVFVIASLAVARMGGTVLLWIARPAAEARLPKLTSAQALVEIAIASTAAGLTGFHSLILLAALIVIVRGGMRYSYQAWGGIRRESLVWTRWALAVATLVIAHLPEPSRSLGGR
ncbi:MAG: hypothetical protein RL328_1888 [Acidobacteriota bacterium]